VRNVKLSKPNPHPKNAPRVNSLKERLKIKGQRFEIGDHYVCGCGCEYWLLLKNGDCVCGVCRRAQARIIVKELAPVRPLETCPRCCGSTSIVCCALCRSTGKVSHQKAVAYRKVRGPGGPVSVKAAIRIRESGI
jgi:hypothetical protein